MLYGWIEVGVSNDNVFSQEVAQDIVLRTIYDNKIIIGNTSGIRATAAMYIHGNNVGINKVPKSDVSLDVNGVAVLKSAQVGLSNTATSLVVNGDIIVKDKQKNFANAMELSIVNNNNVTNILYNGIERVQITNGEGIDLNDNVFVTNDVFATAFQITSDIRFKTKIVSSDSNSDIDIIKHIKVHDYEMKSSPNKVVKGFIAQEVEEVFSQAIVHKRGFTDEGVLLDDIKTIDTNQLLAVNTSVLQTLLARVEALEKIVYADNKPDELGDH